MNTSRNLEPKRFAVRVAGSWSGINEWRVERMRLGAYGKRHLTPAGRSPNTPLLTKNRKCLIKWEERGFENYMAANDLGDKRAVITAFPQGQMERHNTSTNKCIVVRVTKDEWENAFIVPADYTTELLVWLQQREIRPKQ